MPADVSPLHHPPRRPHAWAGFALLAHAGIATAWWRYGWPTGVIALLLVHVAFVWGSLRPGSRLFSPVLTRLPTRQRMVWLTIDDGPSDDTRPMLDLLDAHAAHATFFLVGERAARRPELVREIVRRGHGIGNHSAGHRQAWFWAFGPRAMQREIADAQAVLTQLAGFTPRWFRAVVGMANPFVAAPLKVLGLARVAWSARGYDAVSADPKRVVMRIERDLSPGAIVLLHEGAAHGGNVATLGTLLQRLDALGYRSVLPEQLDADRAAAFQAEPAAGSQSV